MNEMEKLNSAAIDKAFAETSGVLFGKALMPLSKHALWLNRRMPQVSFQKSCMSGREMLLPEHSIFGLAPREKIAELGFLQELGKRQTGLSESESVGSIAMKMDKIAIYITELVQGENRGVRESVVYNNLHDAVRVNDCFNSKHIAYNFFTDYNDHTFGTARTFYSSFCIHCYNSKNLNRAFEADACRNCSDIMFCHNCENVRDSIFCWNAKNLRYAVGNTVLGQGKFAQAKLMLVDFVLSELESKGRLDFDIFEIGCLKRRNYSKPEKQFDSPDLGNPRKT